MLLGNCNKPLEALLEKILHSDEFASVKWHVQVSSTQDLAKNFIRESTCKTSAVFVADSQTSGRGTRGRIWHAPAVNLMMTVVAPLAVSLNQTSGLTLAAGAAAVEVLRAICPKVSMKWPNDLWLNDGKLAGILCETCRTASGHLHVAVGIGVNIAIQDKLKKHLLEAGYPASSLFTLADLPKDVDIVRVHTAARLALALRRAVCEFSSDTISGIASRWDGFDAMLGQQVCFISDDGRMTQGIERGITQNGEIVIDDNGIRRVFSNGSLRPAAGKAAPVC